MSAKISQREAVRNRRDLRKLREFVRRIRGYALIDSTLGSWNLGERVSGKMMGIDWALKGMVVFVARRNGDNIEIGATRVPEIG